MTPPPPTRSRRACGGVLRSLERRLEGMDLKLDHLIWNLPEPYEIRAGVPLSARYGSYYAEKYLNEDD